MEKPWHLGPHKGYWEKQGAFGVEYWDFPGNNSVIAQSRYDGDGKRAQAEESLQGPYNGADVIFGGYSAGGDAAIIAAHLAKFTYNMNVRGVYVLDPGYGTKTLNSADLTTKIQDLVDSGVPVVVFDASGIDPSLALDQVPQLAKKENFWFEYGAYTHENIDDSPDAFTKIYNFIMYGRKPSE